MDYREWRKEWRKTWGWREWFWTIYLWPRFTIEDMIIRYRIKRREKELITDDCGNWWPKYCECGEEIAIMRPGDARCIRCYDERFYDEEPPPKLAHHVWKE